MEDNLIKPTLLVLAAGMGSRFGGLKQIEKFGPNGESIIHYSIYDAIEAGFGKVVFVLREEIVEDFKEAILSKISDDIPIEIVLQDVSKIPDGLRLNYQRKKPWGTAHAVLMAKDVIDTPFLSINADDYYGKQAYKVAADYLTNLNPTQNQYCNIAFPLGKTLSDKGPVARATLNTIDGKLTGTTEFTKILKKENEAGYIKENGQWETIDTSQLISMNMWGFTPTAFGLMEKEFITFVNEKGSIESEEFYIPVFIDSVIKNKIAEVEVLNSESDWFGVTYKEDAEDVRQKLKNLHLDGEYPSRLWD